MKYFLHDTNAFQDDKISELFIEFGYEGLGLFYTILERIAAQEKPVKTSVLKTQLNVGRKLEKCWSFMENLGLICSSNGETFNKQLLSYAHKYKIKKEKNAKRILEWRENQEVKENVTHSENVRNAPKVKVSKVKVNIETNVSPEQAPMEAEFDIENFYKNELPKDLKTLTLFIKGAKPNFPEPYFDIWNLFAEKYKLPKLKALNRKRKSKLLTRLREPLFDFMKILSKSSKSETLITGNWFSFDWVIENEGNFLKILEGNYDNSKNKSIKTDNIPSNNYQVEELKQLVDKKTKN